MALRISNQNLNAYYSMAPDRSNLSGKTRIKPTVRINPISKGFNEKSFLEKLSKIERVPKALLDYFSLQPLGGSVLFSLIDMDDTVKVTNISRGFLNVVRDFIDDDFKEMARHNISRTFVDAVEKRFRVLKSGLAQLEGHFQKKLQGVAGPLVHPRFVANDLYGTMRAIFSEGTRMINLFNRLFSGIGRGNIGPLNDRSNLERRFR